MNSQRLRLLILCEDQLHQAYRLLLELHRDDQLHPSASSASASPLGDTSRL